MSTETASTEPDSYPARVRAFAASDPDAVVVRHVAPDGAETSLTWHELDRRSDALALLAARAGRRIR